MKHNRILILTSVIVVAMAIPIILLQITGDRSVSAETEADVWGDPHIGFVVNTTSGMQPEINQINAAWSQLGTSVYCLTCTYHLTQFRDAALYVGNTANETQFGTWLGNLNAAGGGDCPDNIYAGLRTFAVNVPDDAAPVSDAIVFSDSPPMGNRRAFGFILDKLIENGVRVHNVGTPTCINEAIPWYAMDYLALLSGGEYHRPMSPGDYLTDTMIAMNLAMSKDLLATHMGTLNDSFDLYPLDIDSSITTLGVDHHWWCLTCTRSAENGIAFNPIGDIQLALIDPDGNVIDPDTPGYLQLVTGMRDMHLLPEMLDHDDAGTWQLRVSGTGEYAVNVFGNSTVHMTSLGQHVARVNKPFDVRALITAEEDLESGLRCHVGPPWCGPLTATLRLIGVDNMKTFDVNMLNGDQPATVYRGTAMVTTPGLYRLTAEGTLSDGTTFMRVDPTPIRVRGHEMAGSGDAPALRGSTRSLTFELVNDGTPGRSTATTFDLELFSELGWTTSDAIPDSVTLAPGEAVQYTALVTVPDDAEIGALEESTLVAVPQDDLGATTSSAAGTVVVEELQLFLPSVLR